MSYGAAYYPEQPEASRREHDREPMAAALKMPPDRPFDQAQDRQGYAREPRKYGISMIDLLPATL